MSPFRFFKKKSPSLPEESPDFIYNEPVMLLTQFLFEKEPILDSKVILTELQKEFGQVITSDEPDQSFIYFFPEYLVNYGDKSVPAQCIIMVAEKPNMHPARFEKALQQSWHWPTANEMVSKCHYDFMVSDFFSRGLNYQQRVEYFQKFVTAIIRATNPQAIYFTQSDKLVDPFQYVYLVTDEEPETLNGLLNVRFYNISNGEEGEMMMDTLGLHALGLPDFQVRYKDFEPGIVAGLLTNYANYIYEKGVVIKDGNTIQGLEKTDLWKCHYEDALIEPTRAVINIETGGAK